LFHELEQMLMRQIMGRQPRSDKTIDHETSRHFNRRHSAHAIFGNLEEFVAASRVKSMGSVGPTSEVDCASHQLASYGSNPLMNEPTGPALSLQELPELRRKTETVSGFLKEQIAGYLETLRPLFAPERILGKYAGGKADVTGAERALAELRQNYAPFTTKPFDLPEPLDLNWLTLVGNTLELHPWEYIHPVQGKDIRMSSPVRWVLNYKASYTLAQVKNVLAGKEVVRLEYLRQFAINALVLQIAISRNPGLTQLFRDLWFELKIETPPELKKLPMLTITSSLTSFRPADDLITAATAFSGVPAFIELIDTNAIRQPADPLQARLDALLK
jgi:hypothetical protein